MRQYGGILRDAFIAVRENAEELGLPTACPREQGELHACSNCWEGGSQMRHCVHALMVLGVCTFLPVFPSPVLSLPFQQHGYIHLCLWPAYMPPAVV